MIDGRKVTLVEPFPESEIDLLYKWLSITEPPYFDEKLLREIRENKVRTWAVLDKRDSDIVGVVMFEPVGLMAGRSYVASARKVWGTGMMDEAALLGIDAVFKEAARGPDWEPYTRIQYIYGMVAESNNPAKAFNLRIGMKLKNILPEYSLQNGRLRGLYIFEMTRESWQQKRLQQVA